MTTRVIQVLKDDGWQDLPVTFSRELWDNLNDVRDGVTMIPLRVISRTVTERLIEINAAGQSHERHAAYIAALDSGDEE